MNKIVNPNHEIHLALSSIFASDARLSPVVTEQPCLLEMWILRLPKHNIIWPLYGRVISEPQQSRVGWSVADLEHLKEPTKGQILRARFSSNGQTIAALISRLLNGKTVGQACSELAIEPPGRSVPDLRLGLGSASAQEYAARKPVLHAPRRTKEDGFSSLSYHALTLVGSLVSLNKFESGLPEALTVESRAALLKRCLEALQKDTGLNFSGHDSARLGNLEWAVLMATDPYERPFMKVSFDKHDASATVEYVRVNFEAGSVTEATDVIVRCRTMSDREITGDTAKIVQFEPKSPFTTRFLAGEALTSTLVSVWHQHDAMWHLWAEVECGAIQQIAVTFALEGVHGTTPIRRLEPYGSYEKLPKIARRAKDVQSLARRHYETSMVGDADVAPWSAPGKRLEEQAQKWFRSPSGAQFFPQGQNSQEGTGLLDFAEWFKKLLSGPNLGRVVVADPYFDALGIDHIAGAEVAGLHCQIITYTELKTSDDAGVSPRNQGELPPRAKRLKDACSHYWPYLSGIKFEILDLRRKQGVGQSPRSVFHDRMIVRLDKQGAPLDGYHLSNSLQSAAVNFPLLATPIPSDILPTVWRYVQTLEQGQAPSRDPDAYETVKLIDTSARPEPPAEDEEEQVRQANLLWNHAPVPPDDASSLASRLPELVTRLGVADDEAFPSLWASLTNWVYQSTLWNETVGGLAQSPALLVKLEGYLAVFQVKAATRVDESVAQALSFMAQRFDTALQAAPEHLFDRLLDVRARAGEAREARLAACVLLKGAPDRFVRALDARSSQQNLGGVPTAVALGRLAEHLPFANSDLLRALHQSNLPAFRALSVMHLSTTHRRDQPLDLGTALAHLDLLSNQEQETSLAYWLGSLGLTAEPENNTHQAPLSAHQLELRSTLYQELVRRWRPVDEVELRRIVLMLNLGRLGCAKAITENLFLPLIKQRHLSYDQVSNFWVDSFLAPLDAALSAYAGDVPYQSRKETQELSSSIAFVVARTSDPQVQLERMHTVIERLLHALKIPLARLKSSRFRSLLESANKSVPLYDDLLSQSFPDEAEDRLKRLRQELGVVIARVGTKDGREN